MGQSQSWFSPPELLQSLFAPSAPPDSFNSEASLSDVLAQVSQASPWDVAIRYHEIKSQLQSKRLTQTLRSLSAQAILERARKLLGSLVHPEVQHFAPLDEIPVEATQVDLDLEETLEHAPFAFSEQRGLPPGVQSTVTAQDLWMSYRLVRRQSVVLSVDTSLSMTGEKLALTAVALAVVLLQFPEDFIGIVAFENEAWVLKKPEEKISIAQLVERFLDVPAQGYTHLEEGLVAALKQVRAIGSRLGGRPCSTLLLTDGKYTAGRDPAYLGCQFPHLVVMKMGKEQAGLGLCRQLAQEGSGVLREVRELESLPALMYGVVKDLLRGRSVLC
ncbi:MAG: vWA domain-containing protein [Bdellovibrionia bacterium]